MLLLDKGADIAAADDSRRTPLYWASRNRYVEVVKLLLEKGADMVVVDSFGQTLFYWASEIRYAEVVRLLG
jgi:ankyrin repeat protein